MSQQKNLLVIGATGNFGARICRRLLTENNLRLLLGSRQLAKAQQLADELQQIPQVLADIQGVALNHWQHDLADQLQQLQVNIVIHTCGPFQGQSYHVAQACIAAGCHYIDLADGLQFVLDFAQLDQQAKQAGLLLVTGASTLPGLSSAVIAHCQQRFDSIQDIEISIAPAQQTPRGMNTIEAVLSYCGQSFKMLQDGQWQTHYGWQSIKKQHYLQLSPRLSAVCEVPDLALLPEQIPALKNMSFHAALESRVEHYGLRALAWLRRIGLVKNWASHATWFARLSELSRRFGSQTGGMHMLLRGKDHNGKLLAIRWELLAEKNHGPEIPVSPALVLTRQLLRDELHLTGAMPCIEIMSLQQFDEEVRDLAISWKLFENAGIDT